MKVQHCFLVIGMAILAFGNVVLAQSSMNNTADNTYSTILPRASFISKNTDERIGYSIAGAGDVNGDGYADFMVAAYHNYVHAGIRDGFT